MIGGEPDEHNIASSTYDSLQFIFFFPDIPTVQYGVLHPAYGFHPQYSVYTHMYRMEYEDDPVDILDSSDHMDRKGDCWVLDDNETLNQSCPHLKVVSLEYTQSHLLMIPYHTHSKFKIGVMSQSLWANKFVTY